MSERNYGLDFCRVIAMMLIVMLHILNEGGVLSSFTGGPGYWLSQGMNICSRCSVTLFAVLSGYLSGRKETASTYRAVELISIVLFYGALFTIIYLVVAPRQLIEDIKQIIFSALPPPRRKILVHCMFYSFGNFAAIS